MKKIYFLLLIAFSFCCLQGNAAKKKEATETPQKLLSVNYSYWDRQVVSHRGYKGFPENTIIAFEEAIIHGFKIVECDIAFSKDDVAVLSHDATVNRCSNFKGKVSDFEINLLAIMDFGSKTSPEFKGETIATLKELLILCRRNNVMIDLDCANKERFPNSRYQQLYNMIKKYGMLGNVIFTDDAENLKVLLDIDPNVIVSVAHCKTMEDVNKSMEVAKRARYADFTFNYKDLTSEMVKAIHDEGLMVRCWTVDTLEDMKKCVDMGIDKLTSNVLGPKFDYRIKE